MTASPSALDCPAICPSGMPDALQTCGLWPTRLLCPWGSFRQQYWSGLLCPPPGDLPNPGIKPRSPTLQADSLPAEPQEKPKSTGGGSLSLLQGIFPIQEPNQGPLHCRRTLYQLNYQGSPIKPYYPLKHREDPTSPPGLLFPPSTLACPSHYDHCPPCSHRHSRLHS